MSFPSTAPGRDPMLNFERSSLSKKLTIISFLSTGTALLIVFIAFVVASVLNHRKDEGMQLSSFAGVIGTNSVDALLFNDRTQAHNTLSALKANDEISSAMLFDRQGKLFARYVPAARAAEADPEPPALDVSEEALDEANRLGGSWWSTRMRLYRPVSAADKQIGVVMIEADLTAMWLDMLKSLGVIAAAMGGSLLVAMLMASRFRKSIADPVTKLINAAQKVSASQNYNLRISHERNDELGTLIDSFNDMMAQIEGRGAALTHHRDELERQVSVRTEQLEKAKNAAEAASRAKSAFLATMSHEIRTPMNGVLGMTEMLLGTQLTETQRNFTKLVKRSGEHLLVIINDILDFSKIEAGKLSIEYINFNLWDLLDDISTIYTPQAHTKSIALDFDIANDIPVAICGDPNRLRQIMANLLGNALKFTDKGRILARVAVASEDKSTVCLRFEVHDTGIGVSREARSRIFEAFSQADSSTTRKYGGTGLGLAISRQLVELMGGRIGVENALTQGSVFWFTVSFDKRRVDPDEPGTNLKSIEGLRVLIVDEHEDTREQLEQQLTAWNAVTDTAPCALDAIERLKAGITHGQPFDVAILDMELARTSGLSLAADIRSIPALAGIRLLLMSDQRMAADPVQRRGAGVAYQLIKPPRAGDLFECIMNRPRSKGGALGGALPGVLAGGHGAIPAAAPLTARGQQDAGGAAPGQRRRVLLAEDNPVNIEVAKAMLDSLGLSVVCAENGEQALQEVRAGGFDMVLMDCQMPVMDGFAATAEIRRHEQQSGRGRSLPIIAITANALQGDREACLAAGMDDYLSKPFTQQQLAAVIGRWIELSLAAMLHHDDDHPLPPPPPPPPPPQARRTVLPAIQIEDADIRVEERRSRAAPARPAPSPPPASQRDVVNRHALENIRALSKERGDALVHKVVAAYVGDTPQHLQTLRLAIAGLDSTVLRKVAHSLKSSSANVGAEALAQMCKDMETLGKSDTTDGAAGILATMEQEFQAVRHSLTAILEKEI